ncbi:MAG: hypothetical protein K2W99_04580 [Chthoniobacterales bacterium]|nr:hypothetical protein [Chthoniobacterales bacterium]
MNMMRQGETILILDRHQPIATLSPYRSAEISEQWNSRIAFLSKTSKVTLPKTNKRKPLQPPIVTTKPARLVHALLEERSEGR